MLEWQRRGLQRWDGLLPPPQATHQRSVACLALGCQLDGVAAGQELRPDGLELFAGRARGAALATGALAGGTAQVLRRAGAGRAVAVAVRRVGNKQS